jgi:hypothetical protein
MDALMRGVHADDLHRAVKLSVDVMKGIESYVGERGGAEGVKLEEQVLVTANGAEVLSTYPLEHDSLR